LVVLILVMVGIITLVMNQLIITPIKRLADHADDISHGNLDRDIESGSNDEIGQLAEAFQRMQVSLRAAFKHLQG
jgi:methyl-accepting chemotaxis protein